MQRYVFCIVDAQRGRGTSGSELGDLQLANMNGYADRYDYHDIYDGS